MSTYILIDGNSLTYRAFFAVPADMATASGQVTNAVFGFTSMLVNLIKDHRPDGILVAFDRPEPTFRHEQLDDYKAGRDETPDVLIEQFAVVRELLDVLEIATVDSLGYEADDILATVATQLRDKGDDSIIVTGDRDTYQLVEDPHIKVLYNRRGVSDYMLYDEQGIVDRTGVMPSQYVDYAALRGDPSDNLPGVPGIGEKTAAKLLNTYGNLDGIFAHKDEQTPKMRANLTDYEGLARMNATLMPLVRDVPNCDVDMALKPFDHDAAYRYFQSLEFRTLWQRLTQVWPKEVIDTEKPTADVAPETDVIITAVMQSEPVLTHAAACKEPIAMLPVWEGVAARSRILGLACSFTDGATFLFHQPAVTDIAELCNGPTGYVTHRAKDIMHALLNEGATVENPFLDITIASYLIDPDGGALPLADLLGTDAETPAAVQGTLALGDETLSLDDDWARQANGIAHAAVRFHAQLEETKMWQLWEDIERPLVGVLARMEHRGIAVDRAYLQQLSDRLANEVKRYEAQIHELAGETFNVNSTQQLRTILFEKLGLTPQRKTKTGFSTNAASLERLRNDHPIIEVLLKYREVEKLRSTYGEALLHEIQPDGRIHATFQQTTARTGRLSSDRPNLHNIPVRSDEGKAFRHAFVAASGCSLLVADYNQIELRVIAHLSQDEGLLRAFAEGHDIHTETAARVFEVAPEDVSRDQRSKSKMISYGLAYGMEAFGLSQRLNIEVAEAAAILHAYFAAFPKVRALMDKTVAQARKNGYTETLFGRRRPIRELMSSNYQMRQAGERQAMNAGIQGLAADIFKLALVKLDDALAGMQSNIVLQVHDEIIVECFDDEKIAVEAATRDAMEHAAELDVPLEVHLGWGANWADAK